MTQARRPPSRRLGGYRGLRLCQISQACDPRCLLGPSALNWLVRAPAILKMNLSDVHCNTNLAVLQNIHRNMGWLW